MRRRSPPVDGGSIWSVCCAGCSWRSFSSDGFVLIHAGEPGVPDRPAAGGSCAYCPGRRPRSAGPAGNSSGGTGGVFLGRGGRFLGSGSPEAVGRGEGGGAAGGAG